MTTVKKNAVVTGAASGIGKATAIAFVNKGYHVFGLDIDTVGGVNIESEINQKNDNGLNTKRNLHGNKEQKGDELRNVRRQHVANALL